MMVSTSVRYCVCLLLAAFWLPGSSAQCSADELFVINPTNHTVEEGDTISFRCGVLPSAPVPQQWAYKLFNSTTDLPITLDPDASTGLTPEGYILSIDDDNALVLTVPNITSEFAGRYTCLIPSSIFCDMILERTVYLRVVGSPEIFLPRNNRTYCVDTQGDLTINGIIRGYPAPNVQIYRETNEGFQLISSETNSRFSFVFDNDSATMTLTLRDVERADMGTYMVRATNEHGPSEDTFVIMPRGPDPPTVSLDPVVVARYEETVQTLCSIQPDAHEMGENPITWTDTEDRVVPSLSSGPVYITDFDNGSVLLTITSLTESLTGVYTCTATNDRDTDMATVTVFGPPPAPTDIIIRSGNNVTWKRPTTDIEITGYTIIVDQISTNLNFIEKQIDVSVDHTAAHYIIKQDLEAGSYRVSVFSIAGSVPGTEVGMQTFEASVNEFPLIPVVAGVVGGVVALLVIIVIAIVVYCYCSYNTRKRKINSHQQRWGSEEDKVGSQQHPQPTIPNTYTAIAVHDGSELPPSPLSPMPSSVGIDPKWEFPRENIKPLDVLAEGQFTVLYKGVAKNLREKPCEVAIKALKDDATEDDLKALVYEIDVLSGIEEHPNIVSLIRVCSIGKPLYMVMEYMCHGDLLGFLRACRGHHGMYTVSPGNRYQPPSLQLCSRDLLNMATKIANGMRYLADRKIVHRALCTRNILVGSGMDVKIYNVGSFDITLDNREDGLIKWMAPETLFDGTNTTYSDVWSFGVTLWELVTVGGTPYGEILPEDLYAQLQSGMRMPCPTHCAQEVYDIMSACWQKNPTDRPHFAIIHESLDELVMSKLNYLDLRSYDGYAYSQFGDDVPQLSTAL